jgi:hypothetical protein
MPQTKITNWDRYTEALRMVTEAVGLLDEAAGELKKARISAQAGGYRKPTAFELYVDAESLLKDLQTAECDDCAKPLSQCDCEWLGRPRLPNASVEKSSVEVTR